MFVCVCGFAGFSETRTKPVFFFFFFFLLFSTPWYFFSPWRNKQNETKLRKKNKGHPQATKPWRVDHIKTDRHMRCWWHFQKGDRGVSRHIKKNTLGIVNIYNNYSLHTFCVNISIRKIVNNSRRENMFFVFFFNVFIILSFSFVHLVIYIRHFFWENNQLFFFVFSFGNKFGRNGRNL